MTSELEKAVDGFYRHRLSKRPFNNRKTTRGRYNQYVPLKDEDGNPTGRTRLIRHTSKHD